MTNEEITKELYKICILDENGNIKHIIVYDEQLKIDEETRYTQSFSEKEKNLINLKIYVLQIILKQSSPIAGKVLSYQLIF